MKAPQLFHWSDQFNQSLRHLYHQSQNIDIAQFIEISAQLLIELFPCSGLQWSLSSKKGTHRASLTNQGKTSSAVSKHFCHQYDDYQFDITITPEQEGFSADEETMMEIFSKHVSAAFRLCLQSQINRYHYHAVINREGLILFNSDASNLHIINSKALLKKIDKSLDSNNELAAIEINGTIVFCQPCSSLLMITLWDMSEYQDRLTQKELMVACLIGQFKSNSEISDLLKSSVKTIENQLTKIYQKLSLSNRAQLISLLNQ